MESPIYKYKNEVNRYTPIYYSWKAMGIMPPPLKDETEFDNIKKFVYVVQTLKNSPFYNFWLKKIDPATI